MYPYGDTKPKLKLYYFNIAAKGERIRLALKHAGSDFEDYRFKDYAEFLAKKQDGSLQFGQVPRLEVELWWFQKNRPPPYLRGNSKNFEKIGFFEKPPKPLKRKKSELSEYIHMLGVKKSGFGPILATFRLRSSQIL